MKRDLTIEGKKLIINSFIMSSLSYLFDVYTNHVCDKFVKDTRDLIRDFLWKGKTWRISQKSLALRKQHGGIELPDLDNFIESKKLKWIVKVHFSKLSIWNNIGKYYLQNMDNDSGVINFLLSCTSISGVNASIPHFYSFCLEAWFKFQSTTGLPLSKEQVLNQNLFGNCFISHKRKPIFFFNWTKSEILKIKDIWDVNENKWKGIYNIHEVLIDKRNSILQFNQIKLCIPQEWKNILRNVSVEQNKNLLSNPKDLTLNSQFIKVNGKLQNYKKLKQKDFFCLPVSH